MDLYRLPLALTHEIPPEIDAISTEGRLGSSLSLVLRYPSSLIPVQYLGDCNTEQYPDRYFWHFFAEGGVGWRLSGVSVKHWQRCYRARWQNIRKLAICMMHVEIAFV